MAQKSVDRYPDEYHRLFVRAHEEPVTITAETYRRAHNIRNDLYAFRRALRLSDHKLYQLARNLILRLERTGNGYAKVVVERNITLNHEHILKALGETDAETNPEPGGDA